MERNTRFVGFAGTFREEQAPLFARVALEKNGGEEIQHYSYVIGCDGVTSTVRQELDIPFDGQSYDGDFRHLDAPLNWSLPDDETQSFISPDMTMGVFPQGDGIFRVVMLRSTIPDDAPSDPNPDEIEAALQKLSPVPVEVGEPLWLAKFAPALHLAKHLRRGPVFLAGDSAREVPPTGAQGMNAGLQDAENVGWKLAMVATNRADPSLLDSYEPERRAVSQKIMGVAHLFLRAGTTSGQSRYRLNRRLFPFLLDRKYFMRRLSRRMSQIDIHVRDSPIVVDKRRPGIRPIHAGDPMPPILSADLDERARGDAYTILLYLDRGSPELEVLATFLSARFQDTARVHIVTASTSPLAGDFITEDKELPKRFQFGRRGVIILRPDMQIGYISRELNTADIIAFMEQNGVRAVKHISQEPRALH